MNKAEQIVIDFIVFEEDALKDMEFIMDSARAHGKIITKGELGWDYQVSEREAQFKAFAEKAPVFRERLEFLIERWRELGKKLR